MQLVLSVHVCISPQIPHGFKNLPPIVLVVTGAPAKDALCLLKS